MRVSRKNGKISESKCFRRLLLYLQKRNVCLSAIQRAQKGTAEVQSFFSVGKDQNYDREYDKVSDK